MPHPSANDTSMAGSQAIHSLTVDEIMAQLGADVVSRGGVMPSVATSAAIPSSAGLARWQPSAPRIPVKREYVLAELLSFSDLDFIENAYRAVLRRTPDEAGLADHLSRMRNGQASKVEILAALRWSPEGEKQGVHVDGLLAPYLLQKWRRKPLVGPVLGWLQSFARLSRFSDRQAVLDAAHARETQELGRIVNLQAEQLEQRLARMETSAAIQESNSTAERERLRQAVETVASHTDSNLLRLAQELAARIDQMDTALRDYASLAGSTYARTDQLEAMRAESRLFAEQVGVVSARLDDMTDVRLKAERFSAQAEAIAARQGELDAIHAESRLFAEQVGVVSARLDDMTDVRLQAQNFASEVSALSARLDESAELRSQADTLSYRVDTITSRLDGMPDVVPVVRLMSERLDELSTRGDELSKHLVKVADDMKPLLVRDAQSQEKSTEMDALLVAYEDAFRGGRQSARARAEPYVELIRESGAGTLQAPVLDLYSGRGEWLELLKEHQLAAQGVDANRLFADTCSGRGLQVAHADVLDVLASVPDASLGAVTSMRMVEYLPLERLVDILDQSLRALRPEGVLILHGFNSETGVLGASGDMRQHPPLTPEVMRWLVEARGFYSVRIARPIATRDASSTNVTGQRRLSMTSTAVLPFEASQISNECAVVARKFS